MDDLKMNELVNEWNNTNKSIPFDEWMYFHGCSAQSEADWQAANGIYEQYPQIDECDEMKCPVCAIDKVRAALAAAAIRGE